VRSSAESLRVAVIARAVMGLHGFGGLERSVRDLVRHLAANSVEVTLITRPPGPGGRDASADLLGMPGVSLRHVRYLTFPLANRRGTTILDRSSAYPLFGLRAGRLALTLVRAGAIDIVHGFGASVLGYARARDRAGRERAGATAPLVFNPQGLEEFGATSGAQSIFKRIGYAPLQQVVRRCARSADCIIATDRALEPMLVRHLQPRPGQCRTIPNGIDLPEVTALAGPADGRTIRARHGLTPDETVILSVGRLEHNKGFDVLAAALARAARPAGALGARAWRWVVVGSGPFAREIRHAVDARRLEPHVLFVGHAPEADLHAWYEAATFFAHPARYEGSSLVTLEAMAHRRAIVATTAGGLPDKVRPGVNGWLVPPADDAALARAVEEAASDPARLVAMGAKSRQIVEREFAWSVLVEQYIRLYRELLAEPVAENR
jgi:glycogen(starch) synthase